MELYAYRENGEFIGTIDFYTSLRWRRQYWTAGEVELHLPATKENLAAIQAGVILRRVGRTESARIMGIKTKGGEITANARMLEIYFSMAYVIGTKSFTGTPAEILCQLAEDARESVPELVVDKTALPSGAEITIQLDFKNTLKAMTAVAKAYGLGFRLLFSENQKFTFQVYEGTDRSADQADNNIVYFTDEFQNFMTRNITLTNPTTAMWPMHAAVTARLPVLTVLTAGASASALWMRPASRPMTKPKRPI